MDQKQAPGSRGAGRPRRRRGRIRLIVWAILLLDIAAVAYVALEPPFVETPLEAESRAPYSRPRPAPEELPAPSAAVPELTEPVLPDSPPVETDPAEPELPEPVPPLPSVLPEKSYAGPPAPEFTGAPAPPGLGLVDAQLFGRSVLGLHPELLQRLARVESAASGGRLGVEMLVAYRRGSRSHSRGLAVDVNYFANPYIMHESGEGERNARLGPVYQRIAELMLGRDSVIPKQITEGAVSPTRTLELYRSLREESRAMIAYFRLMQDRPALEQFLLTRGAADKSLDASFIQRQMARDYVTLAGRAGPAVPGLEYPAPEILPGDPPFSGDPTYRAPEFGFLDLSEELVRSFTDAGLRWGGTDMGRNSGDLMHFYLPASRLTKALGSRRNGENPLGGMRR